MIGGETINGFEKCRRSANMTQIEAAQAIGVSQGTISLWENGKAYPPGEKMRTVADVYGCTINELFEREEETA